VPLQHPIERFARHLAGEHESNLDLAIGPYQRRVHNAEALRHESQPGAEVGDAVRGILARSAELGFAHGAQQRRMRERGGAHIVDVRQ
jgi:hypothetical protein